MRQGNSSSLQAFELKGVRNGGEGTGVSEAGQVKPTMMHANWTKGGEQWG